MTSENQAVNNLLLVELPKNNNNVSKNDKYLSIKKALGLTEGDTELAFLICIKQALMRS